MTSPFKFLNAYTLQDRNTFFGRDQEIAELYRMVFKTPLLLVYGASGSGKTSLIQCGLAGRFDGADWLPLFVRRQINLLDSLRDTLSATLPHRPDPELTLPELISEVFSYSLRPVYLIFDQFEELFTLGTKAEREASAAAIQDIISRELPCKILLVIREDFLGHLYGLEKRVPTLFDFRLRVENMTTNRVRGVIASSFAAFHIQTEEAEPDVIQRIIDNLSGGKSSIQLPYLQVYLDTLYREDYRRTYGDAPLATGAEWPPLEFTVAEVAAFGTISDVLERFLLSQTLALTSWVAAHHPAAPAGTVSRILDLFVTEEGTKRPIPYQRDSQARGQIALPQAVLAELGKDIDEPVISAVIDALSTRRLLRISDQMIEVAHDSLAAVIYNSRTEEQKRIGELRRRLRDAYAEFAETGGYLNRKQLNAYAEWLPKLQLASEIEAYVTESERQVRLAEEHELNLVRDKLAAQESATRKQKIITWIIGAALIGALALGVVIQRQRLRAEAQTRRALSDKVGFQAAAAGDRTTGFQLARVAYTIDSTNEWAARQLLYRVYSDRNPVGYSLVYNAPVTAVCFSPDGKYVATATADGTVRLVATADRRELFSWREHSLGSVRSLDFSPDNRNLAIGTESGYLVVGTSDPATGFSPTYRSRFSDAILGVEFAQEGPLLLVRTIDETITLLDPTANYRSVSEYRGIAAALGPAADRLAVINRSGLRLSGIGGQSTKVLLREMDNLIQSVAFSSDGNYLATAAANHRLTVWDTDKAVPVAVLSGHTDRIFGLSFSPDGDYLASASADGTVRVWNWQTNQERYRLQVHEGPVYAVDWSPDGKWIVSASADRTVRFWQVGAQQDESGFVSGNRVALSPDGTQLITTDERGNLWRYRTANDSLLARVRAHRSPIILVGFDPSGRYLLTGALNDTLKLWTVDQPGRDPLVFGADTLVRAALVIPKEEQLVVGAQSGNISWRRIADGSLVQQTVAHRGGVLALAYDPVQQRLASSAKDGSLRFWEGTGVAGPEFFAGSDYWIDVLAFSPDGKVLATASTESPVVRLLRVADGSQSLALANHGAGINHVAFSPDGQLVSTASEDRTVKIWDAETGDLIHDITGYADPVRSAFFAVDGDRVISVEKRTGRLSRLDLKAGRIIRDRSADYGPLTYAQLDRYALPDLFGLTDRVQEEILRTASEDRLEQWAEYYFSMAQRYRRARSGRDYRQRAEALYDRLIERAAQKPAAYYQRRQQELGLILEE